jgi:hypothetical protein
LQVFDISKFFEFALIQCTNADTSRCAERLQIARAPCNISGSHGSPLDIWVIMAQHAIAAIATSRRIKKARSRALA